MYFALIDKFFGHWAKLYVFLVKSRVPVLSEMRVTYKDNHEKKCPRMTFVAKFLLNEGVLYFLCDCQMKKTR